MPLIAVAPPYKEFIPGQGLPDVPKEGVLVSDEQDAAIRAIAAASGNDQLRLLGYVYEPSEDDTYASKAYIEERFVAIASDIGEGYESVSDLVNAAAASAGDAATSEANAASLANAAGISAEEADTHRAAAAVSESNAADAEAGAQTAKGEAEAARDIAVDAAATATAPTNEQVDARIALQKGEPNGLLPADGDGLLPESRVPERLTPSGLSASTAAVVAAEAPSKWEPSSPYLGVRSEAFILRSSDDGDQTSALTAFLADPNIRGRRRLIGYAGVSNSVAVPAGTWVDAEQATVQQSGTSKTALTLGAGARLIGGTILGKTTDYAAGTNVSPTTIGAALTGAGAVVEQTEFVGVANAAVYASAAGCRVRGVRVSGVHGLESITIPSGDAACFGMYLTGGCTDIEVEDFLAENVSIGLIGSHDTEDAVLRSLRFRNILGQHGAYLQNGTGLVLEDVSGHDVEMNLAKIQLAAAGSSDSYGTRVRGVSGRNIGDTVLSLNRPGSDLSTDKKFYGVNIAGVSGDNAGRVLYLASLRGAEVVGISAVNTELEVVTLLDVQDLDLIGVRSRVSGRQVIAFSNAAAVGATGSATKRVNLRGIHGYNPGNGGDASYGYGVSVTGTGGASGEDGRDITIDGMEMHADNGYMRAALTLNSAAHQESFRLKNARSVGHTVNPFILGSSTRQLGEWSNSEATSTIANFPVALPVPTGTVGNKRRYVCNAVPVSGVFQAGDVVDNSAPAAGGAPGWVITTAGALHGGTWAATTAYTVGAWRRSQTSSRVLECTVAGTSGGTQPSWDTAAVGDEFTDGTATWVVRSTALGVAKARASVAA